MPKYPVPEAEIANDRVLGDRQNNAAHHGGIWRAVSHYSSELIAALQAEGHGIRPGSVGENLTIRGLTWTRLDPGDRLMIGTVELEVTAYAPPCQKIAASFSDGRSIRGRERSDARDCLTGLAVNLAGILMLRTGSAESLTFRGAYFEVLSDMVSSLGVIGAPSLCG